MAHTYNNIEHYQIYNIVRVFSFSLTQFYSTKVTMVINFMNISRYFLCLYKHTHIYGIILNLRTCTLIFFHLYYEYFFVCTHIHLPHLL